MKTVEDLCLQKAQECARLADTTPDPLKRDLLSKQAARWRRIALDVALQQPHEMQSRLARERRQPLVRIARHAGS